MPDIIEELSALKADHAAALSLVEEAKASQDSLKTELAAALQASANSAALIATKDTELAALTAQLESLKANEKTAAEKAVEIVAAQGIKPLAVDVTANQGKQSKDELLSELNRITDPLARADFYAAHRARLFDN